MTAAAPVPEKVCDVIMKGGVTSGVVYPRAVVELSRRYRFANIGGTSAGAIAAAVTAAAEYGRATGGFDQVDKIPDDMAANLLKLFQPTPTLKPLFDILISTLGEKSGARKAFAAIASALVGYKTVTILGLAPGIVIAIWALLAGHLGWAAFGAVLALVGLAVALGIRLKRAILVELPDNRFGLCPGTQQPGYTHPAVTEWLADKIDTCAGRDVGGAPLTFGDLKSRNIDLAMMTTNLSMQRPYRLPFRRNDYLFRKSEIEGLFPKRVVDHLLAHGGAKIARNGQPLEDFYHVPPADQQPVVFAARLSLSFPGLFSAVPLYASDFTLMGEQEDKPQLCLFSDGGLSSNFPIHFFDQLWPNAPTFGITLDEYDARRDRNNSRIWLPGKKDKDRPATDSRRVNSGALLPINEIKGLGKFLMTLLSAAKDWQDNLQSTQQGYRERIVHVALKPEEGGLNLTMPDKTVRLLTDLGEKAAQELVNHFDFDEHRWRRFLVAMARVDELIENLGESYNLSVDGVEAFKGFLQRYPTSSTLYRPDPAWLDIALKRAEMLAELAEHWKAPPRVRDGRIPKPPTDLRMTPRP